MGEVISIENVTPADTWSQLAANSNSALIDCRTLHEWDTIGVPDLEGIDSKALFIEWRKQPDMSVNLNFLDQLEDGLDGAYPDQLYFLCRSGARSLEAATIVQQQLASKNVNCACINVAEGFEGDPGPDGQRGTVNGWKFNDLPWKTR